MAESRPNPVTFDRALQREQARQKRHRQGGKQQELSQRLDQQAEIPAVPAKRKKKDAGQRNVLERLGGLAHARTRPSRLALQGSGLHAVVFATALFPLRHTA